MDLGRLGSSCPYPHLIRWPWLVFLVGMALTTVLEYFTSYAMEKIFHARWWDYSDQIQYQRTNLLTEFNAFRPALSGSDLWYSSFVS